MAESGETVHVESLGQFENDQERNVFYFEKAFENLQEAYEDINDSKLLYDLIDNKYLSQELKPTTSEVQDIITYFVNNKKTYGSLINQMLEELQDFLDNVIKDGVVDEKELEKYLSGTKEDLLRALLTMSITGEKEIGKILAALVKINNEKIGTYAGISIDLAAGNPTSLFNQLIKNTIGEIDDDILNEFVDASTSNSVTLSSFGIKYLGVFLAVAYSGFSEGVNLYESSQYGNLTAEDWGWAIGSVAFAGASAWAGTALAASGAGGPVVFAGTAAIIAAGFLFSSIKNYATGEYEIGQTGINGNGLILNDSDLAKLTGEAEALENEQLIFRDVHGNNLKVDQKTAYAILAEDWRNYSANQVYYTEGQAEAITNYFNNMANNDGSKTRQEIWNEFLADFDKGTDEYSTLDSNVFISDLLTIGLSYP